jgi:hypothetical protein
VYDRVSKTFTAIDMFSNYVALLELGQDYLSGESNRDTIPSAFAQ